MPKIWGRCDLFHGYPFCGYPFCQRFRKGVRGRGLATNKPPQNSQKSCPEMCPPSPRWGIGKRVQKRGLNLWDRFLRANPLCPPTTFRNFCCDPAGLVQSPNSWIPPKSLGEGASILFGGWPGSLENVSCSSAIPDLHRCNPKVAPVQETFSRLSGHPPKRLLAPSPTD